MEQNVETRSTVNNVQQVLDRVKEVTKTEGQLTMAHDVMYDVSDGRMKIRTFENGESVLIYYDKPALDTPGPNITQYLKYPVSSKHSSTCSVKSNLARWFGVYAEVKRIRHLFTYEQAVIQIDLVMHVIELEIKLTAFQNEAEGRQIAVNILKDLGIWNEELLSGVYIELFIQSNM